MPIIISRTPVRLSFFGGGTDYPAYYKIHGGAVLGASIDKYTHVSISTPLDYFEHKIRVGYSRTELAKGAHEIEHPSIRECLKFKGFEGNLDIHIFSDLPARTGLGSSSSFTVGFLNALYALRGQRITKQRLAEEAIHIEQNLIAENVGSQDQFHASFGGLNIIEFSASGYKVRPVIAPKEHLDGLQSHLMMFYSGLTRNASQILEEQIQRTQSRSNDSYLKRMHEMVFEAEEILCRGDLPKLGALLDDSWQLKKSLSSTVSTPTIDEAYAAAKRAGALGGKLCGAGSGGFLALLVSPDRQAAVAEALAGMMSVPVRFESGGSTIIYMKD